MEVDVGDDLGGAGACVGALVSVGDVMEGRGGGDRRGGGR